MSPDIPKSVEDVASHICTGDTVFYVGAGFSMVAEMPGWGQLLDELIRILDAQKKIYGVDTIRFPTPQELAKAAQNARENSRFQYAASLISMGLGDHVISETIQKRFARKSSYSVDIETRIKRRLSDLMRAPMAGIITTNYDNLIETFDLFNLRFSTVALNSVNLPNLFRGEEKDKRFFLKIHGDLNGAPVLSSEDYDRVYLSTPKAKYFLRSCLMQNAFVFLGCSIEDAILLQRRELYELFGEGLPPCYQITPKTPDSQIRAFWLLKYAGIQTLFYEASTNEHREFDDLFGELVDTMVENNLKRFGLRPSRIIQSVFKDRSNLTTEKLGITNYKILEVIRNMHGGKCSYLEFLEEVGLALPGVDLENIVYRVAFLVNTGALKESDDSEIILTINDL